MPLLRLDKIIADSGLASRSEAAVLIKHGRVTAEGKTAVSGAKKYDPETIIITVNGEKLEYAKFKYIMMNKPAGFISSTEDRCEMTVIELLNSRDKQLGLFPAGRLDKDAEGFLLLTNDGELAHKVMSPSRKVNKKYYVKLDRRINASDIEAFTRGIVLSDGIKCRPALLEAAYLPHAPEDHGAFVTLREGKYHQVKRMIAATNNRVLYLRRVAIGGLQLDDNLTPGAYRSLTDAEVGSIFTDW